MSVNFKPSQNHYTDIGAFRFWCQKVIPLVYDDSLSYYELLNKVVNYLNETIKNVGLMGEDMQKLYQAYESLQDHVNNYFNNLDVQHEINVKLDKMANDGSLSVLIQPLFDAYKIEVDRHIAEQDAYIQRLDGECSVQKTEINVLKNRMNGFSNLPNGSTTGDAELIDARVGFDGKTYANVGEAIRKQISPLDNELRYVQEQLAEQLPFNVDVLRDVEWLLGGLDVPTLQPNANKGYIISKERYSVSGDSKLIIADLPQQYTGVNVHIFNTGGYVEVRAINIDTGTTVPNDAISVIFECPLKYDVTEVPDIFPKVFINPLTPISETVDNLKKEINEGMEELEDDIMFAVSKLSETDNTKSYFYFHITDSDVNSYFDFRNIYSACVGATFVEWGDGTSTEITTGDDELKHNYASAGDYVITVTGLTSLGARGLRAKNGLYKAILSKNIMSIGDVCFSENSADFEYVELTSNIPPQLSGSSQFNSVPIIYVPDVVPYLIGWKNQSYNHTKLRGRNSESVIYGDTVVTVGAGGDFESINDAMLYLSSMYPVYKSGGVKCEVKILSGTTVHEQIYVERIDLQYITITSVDDVVPVNCDGWVDTADFHDSRADYPFIAGENGAGLPTIGTVFQLVTNTNNIQTVGYFANRGSNGVVLSESGFDGFYDGVIANNESSVTIREGIAKNMTRWGVHSRHNGEVSARSVIATNCGIGAYADRVADLDVREAELGKCAVAIDAQHASRINANGCHANGCGDGDSFIVRSSHGSIVNCNELEVMNSKSHIFAVNNGGTLVASGAITTGASTGKLLYSQDENNVTRNGIIYV